MHYVHTFFTNINTRKRHRNAGFTLLEMLVAIFIFSIALVSLATVSSRGIMVAGNAINQSTAQFLAAEGIELVESRRDDNFLTPNGQWLTGLSPECDTACFAAGYDGQLSPAPLVFTDCGSQCPALYRTNSGLYGYDIGNLGGGETSMFTRIISIDQGNSPDERIVRSRVEWRRGNTTYAVELQKSIFNWL